MNKKSNRSVETFFEDYPLRYVGNGEVIIRPQETLKDVFYIVSGGVIKYDISPSGNKVVVNEFKPGAFFPMSSAINHTQNNYFFEAATETTFRAAPASLVVGFVKSEPDVLYDLLSRVYRGTDGMQRRMAHLMGGDASSRLMFELINTTRRFGKRTEAGITIPMSENDLAKRSGLSRETISRMMKRLKADNLIIIQHGSIVVRDLKKLENQLGTQL